MSLASVGTGCWIAATHGIPVGVWARNLAVWAAGLGLAAIAARTARSAGAQAGFLLAAPVGLAITLSDPGLSGVHRWAQIGPVQANMAEILLPPAVVALGAIGSSRTWTWLVAAMLAVLLVAQPDASQATAFGGALIATLVLSRGRCALRWGGVAAALVAVGAAWLRPDPLAPVPEVEGIFQLAWTLSPFAALAAGSALAAATLTPLLAARDGAPASKTPAVALTAYLSLSALTPALGAFPVPLVGMGVSPILGSWLGAGLLAALASGRRVSPPSP